MMKQLVCVIMAMMLAISISAQKEYTKRPNTYNYNRAMEELQQENYKSAYEYFNAELADNPKNGWAWGWQGYICAKLESYGEAMERLDKAIKLIPKKDTEFLGTVHAIKAAVYHNMDDDAAALKSFEAAMQLDPTELDYIKEHCNILFSEDNFAECEKDVAKMYAVSPNNAVVCVYDGRNKKAQQQHDLAIEAYNRAIKLDDELSSAYSFRAESYMALGKYADASKDVVKALSIDQDDKAFMMLDSLAIKSFTNISTRLQAQRNKEPNVSYWTYCLGHVCDEAKRYCEALEYFKESAKTADDQSQINHRIASIYEEILMPNSAIEYLNKSIDADSTDEMSVLRRSVCYMKMEQYPLAIADINALISLYPDFDSLYGRRGFIRMRSGAYREAVEDFTVAIELADEDPDYLMQRGCCNIMAGNIAQGKADLKAVLKLKDGNDDDDNAGYRATCYGWLYRADNSDTDSKQQLLATSRKYFECDGADEGDMYNAACSHALAGDTDEALVWLEKSLKAGYRDFENVMHDLDLNDIRDTEKFKAIYAEAKRAWLELYGCGGTDDDSSAEYEESVVEVPFVRDGGIYKVKCAINGLPLSFYFDTGAADVTISNVEAAFMLKNGYLSSKDVVGKEYFTDANGDISEGTIFNLRNVEFAGLKLEGVKASVVHSQNAPLLLGQTVLSRLGKIEIDYSNSVLKITKKVKKQASAKPVGL